MNAPAGSVSLSVPGNLLLMGEYAVLEEGGLGVALAVEPRVRLHAFSATDLQVDARWPGGSGSSPFVEAAVHVVSDYIGRRCRGALHVDSSAFFSADGRKTGLGSSAAVTVSVVCALLVLGGRTEEARGAGAAALAVRAHRLAQAGRGSGYDVLASFHGGFGAVRGGASPAWERRALPEGVTLLLLPGAAPVSTAEAVRRYADWKGRNPRAAGEFLQESNSAIRSFLRSPSEGQLFRSVADCHRLGIELGRKIGVPADLAIPAGFDADRCKALGAGNELGVCLLPPGATAPDAAAGCRLIQPATTGVSWAE